MLYNQNSGDTHYLDSLSVQITELLDKRCLSTAEIYNALLESAETAIVIPTSEFALSTVLTNLKRTGLIEVST